ncbi:MAG: methyltransferase domain-containing protein [Planctomycetota bacterium]
MFDFINKAELFDWWDKGYANKTEWHLKSIQDAWAFSRLRGSKGLRICEVGGGTPRVLPKLATNNECWNVDKLEGVGNGPTELTEIDGIKFIDTYLGDFDERLPSDYFDVVFSLSVIEHVDDDQLDDCFRDMTRILKPGGSLLHAIDLYVPQRPTTIQRVDRYRHIAETCGAPLQWLKEPMMPDKISFRTTYATNSDQQLANWNRNGPALRKRRATTQNCSIKAVWIKPERTPT